MTLRRFWIVLATLVLTLAVVIGGLSLTQAQGTSTFNEAAALLQNEQNTIDVIERFGASVVAVTVRSPRLEPDSPNIDPEFFEQIPEQFRFFFRQMPQMPDQAPGPREGSGSAFVIDRNGQLITNYHVVRSALRDNSAEMRDGAEITVTFPSTDEEVRVRVVGVNPSYDLALLELENEADLPLGVEAIPLADSDQLRVGQKAIAIGNPFGLQSTVTTGIVSALARDVDSVDSFDVAMIQTDAAINRGNSGGPLLNSRGELIGINTQILSPTGTNAGIGFAVPSNLLSETLPDLRAGGYKDIFSTRPRIGIGILDVRAYPPEIREALKLPEQGVMVTHIEADGPGDKAGLRGPQFKVRVEGVADELDAGGDVIVAIDGQPVTSASEIQKVVFAHQPGDVVEVTFLRNGEEMTANITLEVVPLAENR